MKVVYQHKRLDNNKIFYIGIGNISRAKSKHGRSKFWKRIVNKVGFIPEILYTNLTWEEACNIEINLIKKYGRRDLGTGCLCNMTDGGEGATRRKKSKKEREAISKRMIGNTISGDITRIGYTNYTDQVIVNMAIFN